MESEEFMTEVKDMISSLVNSTEAVKGASALMKNKVMGVCPNCGANVVEREKGWFCENHECRFVLWKAVVRMWSSGKRAGSVRTTSAVLCCGRTTHSSNVWASGWILMRRTSCCGMAGECRFVLWKDNAFFKRLGKRLDSHAADKLLRNGRVRLKDCRSAKGKTYNATALLSTESDGRSKFTLEFEEGC